MKISKKLSLAMASVATLSIIGATTVFASCKDSGWSFSKWERVEITGVRDKEDDSSAYGSVLSGGGGGDEGRERTTYFTVVDKNGDDIKYKGTGPSVTKSTMVCGNRDSEVINFAYEEGYREVCMKVSRPPLDLGVEANGLWSPDYCRP